MKISATTKLFAHFSRYQSLPNPKSRAGLCDSHLRVCPHHILRLVLLYFMICYLTLFFFIFIFAGHSPPILSYFIIMALSW